MSRKPIRSRRTSAAIRPQGPRALWLAGLGAVALTRRQGDSAFRRLSQRSLALRQRAVQRLRATRTRALGRVDTALAPLQRAIDARRVSLGRRLELSLGRVLTRLGVPSKAEVEELSRRVGTLSRPLRSARR